MFRHIFARSSTGNARRFIGNSTTSLGQDQPLPSLLASIRCLAAPSSITKSTSISTARYYATTGRPRKSATSRKTTVRKTATKSKAKPKAKPKKKKRAAAKPKKRITRAKKPQLTEVQAKRAKVAELRKVALLHGPKLLPNNSFLVYSTANRVQGANATEYAKDIGRQFHNLSASEKEGFEAAARENRTKNEQTKRAWIESHTPWEIKIANNARRHLNRIAKEPVPPGAINRLVSHAVVLLKDPRTVKRASTPYIAFCRERWASGDFKDVKPSEASKSLGREWRALSSEQTKLYPLEANVDFQKYHDVYRDERIKYAEEYEKLYGRKAGSKVSSRRTAKS